MIRDSTRIRITRPMRPVMMKRVLIFTWFGDAPLSGVRVSASAGPAVTSSARTATAAASRMRVLFERKAGRNYTEPRERRMAYALGPSEGRVALLDEGADAFTDVICAEKLMLDLGLQLELRVQVPVDHPVQRALRARVGLRRPGAQPLSELERLLRQRVRVDHAVDQPPVERLLGRDPLAEEGHLERARLADRCRYERRRAAVGHQADVDEAQVEVRARGGDDQVAGEREGGADADGRPVDRSHDRLRKVTQPEQDRVIDL